MADSKIAMVRQRWDDAAVRYTETANKRLTLQCATELHAHLALDSAQHVLEVAAGSGLGSLDIAKRMTAAAAERDAAVEIKTGQQRQLIVTDLSPTMVELAKETLKSASTERLEVQVMEANGQDLHEIPTRSVDRLVSNLCLQLTPDPDAMLRETKRVLKADGVAGFTIWGRPEFSGTFSIDAAVSKELGLGDGSENPNFGLGKDLAALRQRFASAGFSQVRIWPFVCVLERWGDGENAAFLQDRYFVEDEELRARRFAVAKRMGDEWLATKGFPIGLESYIIIARA